MAFYDEEEKDKEDGAPSADALEEVLGVDEDEDEDTPEEILGEGEEKLWE